MNRVDGGYRLKTPVDAIQEFRILTQTAPAEYGGTSGATTTVVTRSGGNELHGNLYEFLRNDKLDARNFLPRDGRAAEAESVRRNGRAGRSARTRISSSPTTKDSATAQGITQSATVPSDAQRNGDFSGLRDPQTGQPVPLINYFTRPAVSRQPDSRASAECGSREAWSSSIRTPMPARIFYVTTQTMQNTADQGGAALRSFVQRSRSALVRYARAVSSNVDPLVDRGRERSRLPGRRGHQHAQRDRIRDPPFSGARRTSFRAGLLPQRVRSPTSR